MSADDDGTATGYRWTVPLPKDSNQLGDRRLRIFNSFSRKKEPLVTNDRRTIRWYCCGPTVYDVSHLGHARCYITFDIIRRILGAYFGYQVFYVVNITDIDDKIIKRARSNYLFEQYCENLLGLYNSNKCKRQTEPILSEIQNAIDNYKARRAEEQDPNKLVMINNVLDLSSQAFDQLREHLKDQSSKGTNESVQLKAILDRLRDVIADDQDNRLAHTVSDHKIFKSLTMSFEKDYFEDMQRLDVLPPSALSRVSEYIDEIGEYIQKLESNGYAYRSGGSVYFDTDKFDKDPKHSYAKLVREAYGHKRDLDEGEGELSSANQDKKRSSGDFALWKKSKPGEPQWQTQDFEPGRPGWHIECSVMASKLLGENFDIHSGGCDLKFPHHDNEIAQAEAYYDTGKDWVNYFVHSGHLTISGCKMSKSLKNFITIRQALQEYTSRQLRFAFLVHGWTETLDYSPNTMNTALCYERCFREFLLNLSDIFRRQSNTGSDLHVSNQFEKWSDDDINLNNEFLLAVNKVDSALCDSFDTRSCLNVLFNIVKEFNKRTAVEFSLAKEIARYVKRMLSVFGADFDEINLDKYLHEQKSSADANKTSGDSGVAMKYVEALAQFRADVRQISKGSDPNQSVKQLLDLCDELRDKTLPSLGIRLEDKEVQGAPYAVKFVDPETLAKEKAMAERKEQEKKLNNETQRLKLLKLKAEREQKAKIPPQEMFRSQTDKYSQFDERGMPTHDSTGKELSKSALKKLQRMYEEQEARYKSANK